MRLLNENELKNYQTTDFEIFSRDTLLPHPEDNEVKYFGFFDDTTLVGIIKIRNRKSYYKIKQTNFYWFAYIEVNKQYRNRGLSKIMVSSVVSWMKQNCISYIVRSASTKDGMTYIEKFITNLFLENNIAFHKVK